MTGQKKTYYLINSFALLVLFVAGVSLFFMREKKLPGADTSPVIVRAKPSSRKIIEQEFLILMSEKNAKKIFQVLDPLGLEIKYPLLNWVLVGAKNVKNPNLLELNDEKSELSRSILNTLKQHELVLDAQHNHFLDDAVLPTNFSILDSWQLNERSLENKSALNLPLAWEISQGSKKTRVAIVDQFLSEGIFVFEKRFSACNNRVKLHSPIPLEQIVKKQNDTTHGELSLLAVGACLNEKAYSPGVDWYSELLAVEKPGAGQAQVFLAALYAAGIDICQNGIVPCPKNFIFVGNENPSTVILLALSNNSPDLLQFSADMVKAINQKGSIVVAAAGNSQVNALNEFLGGTPGVISVGAINKDGNVSSFSNWGPMVDAFAPGSSIEFIFPSGIKTAEGTSISAAYVAGVVSILKSINDNLGREEIVHILQKSAETISCKNYCQQSSQKHKQMCEDECCQGNTNSCSAFSIDANQAFRIAQSYEFNSPLTQLESHYLTFLRAIDEEKQLSIKNRSQKMVKVRAQSFDDNVIVEPWEFLIKPLEAQQIKISFKKEPFKRQVSKILFHAENEFHDRPIKSRLFLEYIPRQ